MSKAYKKDFQDAKRAVYDAQGMGDCPYEEGTRIARLWHKWKRWYWMYEDMI